MRILKLPVCPVCRGDDFLEFDLGGGNLLRRCTRCDTVSAREYADPAEVYVDGYMFGEAGDFGLDVTHPRFQEYLIRVGHRRLRMIERVTGARGALLDVGCGTGEVLSAARDRGWRVRGVEPERTAAEMARERGIEVDVALLEDAGLPERSFDVVSAFHVLEHQPDAGGFLAMLARWARRDGFVAVEVPNFNSLQRRRWREGWPGLRPLEHLVHFTPETLRRAFLAAGLDPVLMRSPAYVGRPQNLDQATRDLTRQGRLRRLLKPLSPLRQADGDQERYPSRLGWGALRAAESVHSRAGVGTVVICVARVRS